MAPKKKADAYEDDFVDDGSDYEAPKKKSAPKKKATGAPEGEAKPKKAKPQKFDKPTVMPDGFTIHPPSLIYLADPAAQGGKKVAAIDLDGTLVVTKSGQDFARGADDWRWFNQSVPAKLHELVAQGYQLLIISNQGGIKGALDGAASNNARGRIAGLLADARKKGPLPAQVFMATQSDSFRKPETGMWDFFVANCNVGVEPDKSESFYCGDMAGRDGDIETTDRTFATNIGIGFKTPEELFGERDEGPVATGPNAALANVFKQLADKGRKAGDNMFKINAYEKVHQILAAYPDPITSTKQVAKEKGVGKSSLAKIEEFLTTGKVASLEEEGQGAAAAAPPKDNVALKFL